MADNEYKLWVQCSICGCRSYITAEEHHWFCSRAERAIEEDRDKERFDG